MASLLIPSTPPHKQMLYKSATPPKLNNIAAAGTKKIKHQTYKRRKNYVRVFVTFISSVVGRTINKSACSRCKCKVWLAYCKIPLGWADYRFST